MERCRRRHPEGQTALLAAPGAPSRLQSVVELGEGRAGLLQECSACLGQDDAARPAKEQLHVQFPLDSPGLATPRGVPDAIVARLDDQFSAGLVDLRIRAKLDDMGAMPFAKSAEEFGQFIAAETGQYREVILRTRPA